MQLIRDCVKLLVVISVSQLQLVTQGGRRYSCAHVPKIGMSIGNSTILSIALTMRAVTLIVCMLGAEAPAACLPEGTFLPNVIGR